MTGASPITSPTDITALFQAMTPRYAELAGQVAVVTGAAKGIGQDIATRLAAEGMRVVAADIDKESLAAMANSLRDLGATVVEVSGDLSRAEDIDAMFESTLEAFGTVDVLVNNAADLHRRRLLDEHDALLDLQLATNVVVPIGARSGRQPSCGTVVAGTSFTSPRSVRYGLTTGGSPTTSPRAPSMR